MPKPIGTLTIAAAASTSTNFQNDNRQMPAVRKAAARMPMTCRAANTILAPCWRYRALSVSSRSGVSTRRTTPLQHPLAPVMADRVEGDVAAEHAQDAHGQRDPPVHDVFVGEDAAGDDRDLFGNGEAETRREQREEESGVREVLDELLDHGLY